MANIYSSVRIYLLHLIYGMTSKNEEDRSSAIHPPSISPHEEAKLILNAVNAPNATTTRTSPSVHFEDARSSSNTNTGGQTNDESTDSYHSANDPDENSGMLARLPNIPPSVAAVLSPDVLARVWPPRNTDPVDANTNREEGEVSDASSNRNPNTNPNTNRNTNRNTNPSENPSASSSSSSEVSRRSRGGKRIQNGARVSGSH